ncbi:N-acetyl-beta-glucosaminyl-glycoprotein 4-beta-N-acetylgalactosaminyltransferase 1-like [Polyodon spathula]|uniref:N-acetyl-beta-glucosaminyl-glycoprotein 4-beta-N-acetylgalactosaminyltransferase 1-like n=1 Tax=Polyodon spathula TaxID=7913 RepID=UPI001B7E7DC5|nr:N-acetyl-beta-glucosaminyl-glycoprotein 4-beta-N-acetylgalactosaminyltransferase 1-like [Polyodon spathula]
MLRLPVKKIRKQFKLLLLLVLLTFAVWFTYLHISLVRQGKAIKLHINYGKDGEKPNEGTDGGRNRDSSNHRKPGDSHDSGEDEHGVDGPDQFGGRNRDDSRDSIETNKFLSLKQNMLPWTPEYKGQANLHVFEDWCGSSVNQLRKNLHFPLYPHTRTVVKKLAVAPKWKNYGLRIFGYIHPYRDGDFQFAVSSDDNSEFWLSSDENPVNARLVVYVGKLGSEWTAPGEFTKFRSQVSKSVHLIFSRRYYFEVLHKQDDKGSDHIEVGWRPFLPGLKFEVIDSPYISLYTDEASLKMNSVDHIPQTHASHARPRDGASQTGQHGADMLKPDARDTFFLTPMIEPSRLENVLPACLYSPTYVVKDFPIARYQGLQFVYLSFVYPNDFTRLTHMETENKCFYRESPIYLEKFGFYKYMKMDEEKNDRPFFFPNPGDFPDEEEGVDPEDESLPTKSHPIRNETNTRQSDPHLTSRVKRKPDPPTAIDYGDDVDDYAFRRRQKVFRAEETQDKETQRTSTKDPSAATDLHGNQEVVDFNEPIIIRGKSLSWIRIGPEELSKKGGDESAVPKQSMPSLFLTSRTKQIVSNSAHAAADTNNHNDRKKDQNKTYITRPRPNRKTTLPRQPREVFPGVFLYQNGKTTKLVNLNTKLSGKGLVSTSQLRTLFKDSHAPWLGSNITKEVVHGQKTFARKWVSLQKKEVGKEKDTNKDTATPAPSSAIREVPPPTTLTVKRGETDLNSLENTLPLEARVTSYMKTSEITETQLLEAEPVDEAEEGGLSDYSYEDSNPRPGWAEESINWQRTFTVNTMDFELLRSDWNDLRCNVSGNLQLSEAEVVDVLAQYMEKLNERNGGIYTLLRIINMEKRRDSARGNRYLIELELMERGRRVVRLSWYIYLLLHRSRHEDSLEASEGGTPPSTTSTLPRTPPQWGTSYSKPLLCQPLRLQWRHNVMVHFVVPVKNQARWVQQFINDMEFLHQETKDDNFSVIIVDYESEDMDVEKALRDSKLPRAGGYQYMRREGNFERSAGLQAGVDSIEDSHSIVFLCDLHIHFPLNIVESVRKHCVEGRLAYAPIVMRLACGSSPREPNGYWEVNGFGLFGIYKSDFDKIGGMNTEEFRDRWGGEDWELLDRVLQNGLEVERLRLRNFFHYYHSKRGMWNSKKPPKG